MEMSWYNLYPMKRARMSMRHSFFGVCIVLFPVHNSIFLQAQAVVAPATIDSAAFGHSAIVGQPVFDGGGAPEYAAAVRRFEGYVVGKKPGIKNDANLPFLLSHGGKAARSILMVHGLTDSPYYMRSLADVFYGAGYNVVSILLPGHGTRPENLLDVRLEQWQAEVQFGLDIAGRLGEQVSLAGFSTGGALVLDALAKNYAGPRPLPMGDVFLFSPALEVLDKRAPLGCSVPWLTTRLKPWKDSDPNIPEDHPYRYRKFAVNAICQLYRQTLQDLLRRSDMSSDIAAHGIGVFAVQSEADEVVSAGAVVSFMNSLRPGVRNELILYPKESGVDHTAVTRPESNPYFGALAERIKVFILDRGIATKPPIRFFPPRFLKDLTFDH